MTVVIIIILMYFLIIRPLRKSKNAKIDELNDNIASLRKGVNYSSEIIREANIKGVPPKDLD